MNLRLHVSLLLVVLVSHSVISAIETSALKSVGHEELGALDDLYIDDEGDDDIQLQDEMSGSGPGAVDMDDEDEDYDDGEDLDEDEEDEDDDYPDKVREPEEVEKVESTEKMIEMEKKSDLSPILPPQEKDEDEEIAVDEVIDQVIDNVELVTPRVSPVAVSPLYPQTGAAVHEDYDVDEDYASGSGASPTTDDEDASSAEDDYDDDYTSITGENDPRVLDNSDTRNSNHEVVMPLPPAATEAPKVEVALAPEPAPAPTGGAGTSVVEHPSVVDESAVPKHNVDEDSAPTTDRGGVRHGANATSDGVAKNGDRQASFFAQPGILAAVIGGAVVGLLCAILLVMFIVYRMRKKDEGSYALEEPKRNSPNSHPYNKNSREFYA